MASGVPRWEMFDPSGLLYVWEMVNPFKNGQDHGPSRFNSDSHYGFGPQLFDLHSSLHLLSNDHRGYSDVHDNPLSCNNFKSEDRFGPFVAPYSFANSFLNDSGFHVYNSDIYEDAEEKEREKKHHEPEEKDKGDHEADEFYDALEDMLMSQSRKDQSRVKICKKLKRKEYQRNGVKYKQLPYYYNRSDCVCAKHGLCFYY